MNEHWESALADLRERLSEENFDTWLGAIRFDGFDGKRLRIRIPNRFYADWIRMYTSEEYETVAAWLADLLDRLTPELPPDREAGLRDVFMLSQRY